MSENQSDNKLKDVKAADTNTSSKKDVFGALTPLTTAQIITLLVGTTSSNSSYGGY